MRDLGTGGKKKIKLGWEESSDKNGKRGADRFLALDEGDNKRKAGLKGLIKKRCTRKKNVLKTRRVKSKRSLK